jgi:hypothetical protein
MFPFKSDFTSPPTGPKQRIEIANGDYIFSHGSGQSTFGEALYVPDLSTGLISTAQDDLFGKFTVYGKGQVSVYNTEPTPTSEAIRGGILLRGSQYVADESNPNLSRKVSVSNTGQHRNNEFSNNVNQSFDTNSTSSVINFGENQLPNKFSNNVNQSFDTNSTSSVINFGDNQNNVNQSFDTNSTSSVINFGDNQTNVNQSYDTNPISSVINFGDKQYNHRVYICKYIFFCFHT